MFKCRANSLRLYSINHLYSQRCNKIRIFAITFQSSSPSLVTNNVQNRSINICISQSSGFLSNYLSRFIYKIFIPCTSYSNRSWQRSCLGMIKTMNTFIAEINRNTKSCLFDKPFLNFVDSFGMITEWI